MFTLPSTAFLARTSDVRSFLFPALFAASAPCDQAIHLPSRSIACKTDLLAISCGARNELLLAPIETDLRGLISGVFFMTTTHDVTLLHASLKAIRGFTPSKTLAGIGK